MLTASQIFKILKGQGKIYYTGIIGNKVYACKSSDFFGFDTLAIFDGSKEIDEFKKLSERYWHDNPDYDNAVWNFCNNIKDFQLYGTTIEQFKKDWSEECLNQLLSE